MIKQKVCQMVDDKFSNVKTEGCQMIGRKVFRWYAGISQTAHGKFSEADGKLAGPKISLRPNPDFPWSFLPH